MADGDAVSRHAKRYFVLARSLIEPKSPTLVAIGGPSGTGKSVLARALAGIVEPPPGAVVLRSDVVRKHLFDVSETTRLPEEAYQAATTQRLYDLLARMAGRVLAQGCSVILDAAFLQEFQRGLFLTAGLATRLSRIERREHDASDATREVAIQQEATANGAANWHTVDASGTPEDTLQRSIAFLSASDCPLGAV